MTRRSLLSAVFLGIAGALSASGAAAPGINPTADAFVNGLAANVNNNYGAAGALSVGASGLSKGEFDSFIRFNLGSTKTYFDGLFGANSYTVQSVTLQLTAASPNNAIFNNPSVAGSFGVQLNNNPAFVEGAGSPSAPDTTTPNAINFSNRGNYENSGDPSLGTFSFAGGTSGSTVYTLTLANGLLADIQAGSDLGLYLSAADSNISAVFNSTNFGTAASRPTLVVNAVASAPEPAVNAMLFVAAGAFGFGIAYRRRQRNA